MNPTETKITYRKLMVPEDKAAKIAVNLGFNEEGKRWYVYRIPRLSDSHKIRFEKAKMQVYMPKCVAVRNVRGRKVLADVPKFGNYLFVLATQRQVEMARLLDDFTPVYNHRREGERLPDDEVWLTVPTAQMHQLMILTEGYEQEVEFETPDSHMLEKGDKVRVIAGRFKDLEGVLLTNQGSHKGGRIYVEVTNRMVARTAYIPDEYIQVLEFSHSNNHFFRKVQATEKLFDEVLHRWLVEDKLPTSEQRAAMQYFLLRYSQLGGLTHVNYAKITACRYVANVLLSRREEARRLLTAYQADMQKDRNSRRALRRYPSAQEYIDKWVAKVAPVANLAS